MTSFSWLKRFNPRMAKKGNINMLTGGAIGFTVLFTVIAVAALILSQIGNNATVSADGNATAAVNNGKVALNDLSSLSGILVFVLFLAVVVGFFAILGYAGYRSMRR